MQYHLNGFKPGNYQIPDSVRKPETSPPLEKLPTKVDVLIIGCGPAGLTLARQLSEFSDISTCIVDQKPGPMLFGQADGISCRTMEIMEAFNSSELLVKETYQLHQNSFWEPDETRPNDIKRTHKVPDARLGLSEFIHGVVNQARLHDILLDGMKTSPAQIIPHYSRQLLKIDIDQSITQDLDAYPISVTFDVNDDQSSIKTETMLAKYIIGCDGARSTVRKNLSIELIGESANKAWGVMDVLLVTDFPDIRIKSFIQSKENGAVMLIPREGGYLVRFYVELNTLDKGQRVSHLDLTVDDIISKTKLIMAPYEIDIKEVAWWSIYEVGQRIAARFDDLALNCSEDIIPRAFVAGDACHTHSPKGGWGLNTSLPDTFNLGWKLASVIQSKCHPKLLRTYSSERRKIAQQLIDADKEMSKLVATHSNTNDEDKSYVVNTTNIEKFIARQNGFIAGTSIQYDSSFICNGHENQHLAEGFKIGQRFHSAKAIRLSDGRPQHLGHLNKADGRWRIFIFNNSQNPMEHSSEFYKLIEFLTESLFSPILKFTPKESDIDSVIDVYSIFQQDNLSIENMPDYLIPSKGKYGLKDYEKVFYSCKQKDIYELREIDRAQGCMVLVRPDQHVANILPLNNYIELSAFFDNFMVSQ